MTARANYERKMAHTFAEDVKRADFQAKLGMDKMLMGNATSDERVANKRRARVAGEQAQVPPCVPFCCACQLPVCACQPEGQARGQTADRERECVNMQQHVAAGLCGMNVC